MIQSYYNTSQYQKGAPLAETYVESVKMNGGSLAGDDLAFKLAQFMHAEKRQYEALIILKEYFSDSMDSVAVAAFSEEGMDILRNGNGNFTIEKAAFNSDAADFLPLDLMIVSISSRIGEV